MKRLFLLTFIVSLAAAIPASAQSVDASVGYSYFHFGNNGGVSQNGISGSVAFNPNRWLGFVSDFGGYHGSVGGVDMNTYTYLFGPRFSLRNPSGFTPFVQALVGGSTVTFGGGFGSTNQFAYSAGVGVDVKLLPHLALRPQVDYVGLETPGNRTNCTRASLSFVVHF